VVGAEVVETNQSVLHQLFLLVVQSLLNYNNDDYNSNINISNILFITPGIRRSLSKSREEAKRLLKVSLLHYTMYKMSASKSPIRQETVVKS
jgi:hypothetical protein